MKLDEVFDTPLKTFQPIDFGGTDRSSWEFSQGLSKRRQPGKGINWSSDTYRFTVDDNEYELLFSQGTKEDELEYGAPNDIPEMFDAPVLNLIRAKGGSYVGSDEITGTGNAFKVFSIVFKIIEKHRKKENIPIFVQAQVTEPSRVKFYSRLYDKIATHKWTATYPEGTPNRVSWMLP